jgi:hypothetical protein
MLSAVPEFRQVLGENYPSDCAQSIMQAGMPAMQEPITQTESQAESAALHPEETRASVDLRIGKNVALKATVRTTPAGLVTAGVMVAAIVLSITVLVRAIRRRDPPGGAIH